MSDLSILRWRIEQQSEMIMNMKTNLDESTAKLKMHEKIIKDTRNMKDIVSRNLKEEEQRIRTLERDLGRVSVNYNQLTKTKEKAEAAQVEMKQYIANLEKEGMNSVSKLADEKLHEVREKNKLISAARISLGKLDSLCNEAKLSNDTDTLIQETEVLQTIQARTKAELIKIKEEQDAKLKNVISRLKTIQQKRAILAETRRCDVDEYHLQNEEMMNTIEQKNKEIRQQRSLQSNLEQQETKLKNNIEAVEKKFHAEKHLIDVHLRVKKLKEELQKVNEENQKAQKKFAAYQKHAERLIEREMELNRRFKFLDNQVETTQD